MTAVEADVLHTQAEGLRTELNDVEIRLKLFDKGGTLDRAEEQKLKELKDLYSLSVMALMDEAQTKYASAAQFAGKNKSGGHLIAPSADKPLTTGNRRSNDT